MTPKHIDTAVIPLAGLGTRMAPFTTAVPKFMAPISHGTKSRPNIDYTLDECLGAGIHTIIFIVSGDGREQLHKYLGPLPADIVNQYLYLGKQDELAREQARRARFAELTIHYVEQPAGIYGTAVPLSLARDLLRTTEYFAITGGDDFIWHADGTSELALAIQTWQASSAPNAILGKPVPHADAPRYGVLQLDDTDRLAYIDEKPPLERAPAEPLVNISRYILRGDSIWPYLETELAKPRSEAQREYYITDVINAAVAGGQAFQAHHVQGTYLDAGTPQTILQAGIFLSGCTLI